MGFEKFNPLAEDQKKKTKSRLVSDAELIKGGAEIRDDGVPGLTEEQIKKAKQEMEGEKGYYLEQAEVNGINIQVYWDEDFKNYTIYFPQIKTGEEASEKGVSDQVIKIDEDRKTAQKVFEFARQTAQAEEDVYELYKKVEEFIRDLTNPEEE